MDNSTIYDVQVINASEKSNDATAAYGVELAGSNNVIHDVYIDYVAYSGTSFTDGVNLTAYNIKVIDAGHNGFEVEVNDSKFTNIYIQDSHRHNLFQVGKAEVGATRGNNIYEEVTSINSDLGYGACITEGSFDTIIANSTFIGKGPYVSNSKNITLLNVVQRDAVGSGAEGVGFLSTIIDASNFVYLEDVSIIDSDFSDNNWNDLWINDGVTKIVNTQYSTVRLDNDYFSNNYYLDLIVLDSNGNPFSESNIALKNEDSAAIESSNGFGMDMTSFLVDSNGRTYDPQVNRAQSPVMAGAYRAASLESVLLSHKATINTPSGDSVALTGITPDSTWYREDPNTPTYTITAVIPDSTTGPHITGFAPSSENPFTAGETKKFQIWTDEELTTMKWYVNGNLRSSGSMTYDWTVETGSHTIMFAGSNSNGAVVQTWEVTEGEVPSTTPGSSGTGVTFTPSTTSLTATAGESTTFTADSTDELVSSSWSYDGVQVATGTSYVQNWDKVGTHTVEFLGTTTTETVTNTWTVEVSEQTVSEYSSISISASAPIVKPGESFTIDVYIDPTESITGSQFDLQYSQLASVTTVAEGDLFTQSGLSTMFEYEGIDNTLGILTHVYSAIVGSGTVSTAGTMATITMTAGSESGILDLGLNNVIVSDANSAPAGYTVTNATVLVDTAPVFATTASQTVEEGQSLSFTVSATDAEGDSLTYSATSLPSGASFDGQTFSWTPAEGDDGSYSAVFEVTDGYLSDSMTVAVTVTPMNHAPVITLFEPADSAVFEEGSTINVNVIASDADGESLSYIIKIDGVQVTTASSYAWAVDYESAGTHTIEVIVSDGIDEVRATSTITITDLQPRWDVNEDGVVNVLDITLIGQNYGATYTENPPRWDVNQDGTVNIQDLSIVSGHFGETI
ncbi:Ig-like domain-containing protein [Methanolobus profundi]|nr:dockerin type I domain-containing protein [Methanolobus profundi]